MIYLLGAGKSAIYLIEYLGDYLHNQNEQLVVLDLTIDKDLPALYPQVHFEEGDLYSEKSMRYFEQCKVVISFLPAFMHFKVAQICLEKSKHLVTASYATEEIRELGALAASKGITFLFELGLDPGIDHMSAMQMTHDLKVKGHDIYSFKSYCGALVAPSADNNPWHYKFTWNPMNVVLAGQSIAAYVNNGSLKYMTPDNLYKEAVQVKTPQGTFDGYYNRDSVSYQSIYELENTNTFIRGTLRGHGFCKAWQVLIDLGLTIDHSLIHVADKSIKQVISSFILEKHLVEDLWLSIQNQLGVLDENTLVCLKYLELDSNKILNLDNVSPAQYLLEILKPKWALMPSDKDRVVLWHEVKTRKNGEEFTFNAVLDLVGESESRTAIAKTVSLPAAFAAQLLYEDKIKLTGLHIPVKREIYQPILSMLAEHGIVMHEF